MKEALSMMSNELLAAIIKGDVNAIEASKKELELRGCDQKGNWTGFKK